MTIFIPTPLRSYTAEKARVQANGATLAHLLQDMNSRYPGIRFRMIDEQGQIRPHIKIFVNQEQVRDLSIALTNSDDVLIVCALSGG